MKFVINTSFDPHFCALFNETNKLVASAHWMIPKEDGQHVWNFLKEHLTDSPLTFIGGISGPGSFSSLRAGGAILNALSFKFKLPIHQARADVVIIDYLNQIGRADDKFLLNSFGQRVFTLEKESLQPHEAGMLGTQNKTPYITTWIPAPKAALFSSAPEVEAIGPLNTILETLEKTTPQPHFIPDYEYPPVQN